MKNSKFILILIISLFLCNAIKAQNNSSFLGNRVLFNLGVSFSPAWKNPNFFNNSDHWNKYYSFNYDLSPNIEVIAWKKGTVGAVYHWYETKFDHPEIIKSNIYDIIITGTSTSDLTVHGFGVYYKQYLGHKSRAPIGAYIRFQFDGYFYSSPSIGTEWGKLFAFKTEIGRDFLFFDRLHVSTGFSLGIPFCNWWKNTIISRYSFDDYNNGYSTNSYMYDFANFRLAGHYYLGFYISIGILAF